MAVRKSTRARRGRAASSLAGRREPVAEPGPNPEPELDTVLGHFSDALACAETACRALEAAEDGMEVVSVGSEISALRQSVQALRRVYSELDLAILAFGDRRRS